MPIPSNSVYVHSEIIDSISQYDIAVFYKRGNDWSACSGLKTFSTNTVPGTPSQPLLILNSAITFKKNNGGITIGFGLRWNTPANHDTSAVTYQISDYLKNDTVLTSVMQYPPDFCEGTPEPAYIAVCTTLPSCGSENTCSFVYDLDLTKVYYLRVRAINAIGASPWSSPSDSVTAPGNSHICYTSIKI
jgi:hypothetical protein